MSERSTVSAGPAAHIRPLLKPEAALLWSLGRWNPGTPPPDDDPALNWPLLLAMARQERAFWVVDKWLKEVNPASISAENRQQVHELARVAEFRMHLLAQRVDGLTGALNAAGITPWLLKGAGLSRTHYRSFAERHMHDIDLLVESDALAETARVASEQGWETQEDDTKEEFYWLHHHGPPMIDSLGTGLVLEIHRNLVGVGHPFRTLPQEVLAQGNIIDLDSGKARVPLASHQLVHIGVHYAWSHSMGFGAWTAFRDVRALADDPEIQWDEVVRLATVSNATSCCYWTLRLAKGLVGADIPSDVLERLRPRGPEALLTYLERHYVVQAIRETAMQLPQILHRSLWRLGVQPGNNDHRGVLPWLRDPVFRRRPTPTTAQERRRFRRRVQLAFKATGYLGTLAVGRSPRRQRLDWE